ncbi:MAG: peptidase M28 [Acidobacteria bacterium]|nr:MAG: peptidase M28 [Acidobacteriota bacterium]
MKKYSPSLLVVFYLHFSISDLGAQNQKSTRGIDADLAFAHVKKLVSFGPRPPGSPGIAQAQSHIASYLKKLNLQVEQQDFLATTPAGSVAMRNIVAKATGEKSQVIVLASHYDTKLMHGSLFVGANDGASSTGLLMELARVISQQRGIYPVWFVFFDGEEAQRDWTETDSLYGSRYFVEKLKGDGTAGKVKAMILLDMVGDKDLVLERDLSSTPWLLDLVIKSAYELGYGKHIATLPKAMTDDHIPFVRDGIPAVDLIDYNFGFDNLYWHSVNDTLDKVSPQSLKVTGEIVLRTLNKLEAK